METNTADEAMALIRQHKFAEARAQEEVASAVGVVLDWPRRRFSASRVEGMNAANINKFIAALETRRVELKSYGVERIGLFGSCVRGEECADSDVDLLVDFEPKKKTLANLVDLADFLEGLFRRRVEVVTRAALSPYLGPQILQEVQYANLAA